MAKKFGPTIKKLQNAINQHSDLHIVVNKTQYYVQDSGKIAEIIIVKKAVVDDKGKTKYEEMFSSGSDIAITLFLRDLWYEINGWEIPRDNEYWEEQKRKYTVRQANRKKAESEKKGVRAYG